MWTLKPVSLALLLLLISGAALAEEVAGQPGEGPTIAVVDLIDKGPSVELAVLRVS